MKVIRIIAILLVPFLLTGCFKDDSFNRAECGDEIYHIKSITRWSDSNYTLRLENGDMVEVHPINCKFYNEESEVEE